jgi:hypothetical protein
MIGYKGFDKDMKCRGFQYEVGKEYKEDKAEICESGFHFCEFPFDVFGYYEPATSRYATVSPKDKVFGDNSDSKKCTTKIKVETEIGLPGIIKAGVEYIKEKVDWKNAKESNTGNQSAATNTGNWSAATNTGNWSAATNTGDRSAATNTGNWSAATNTGNWSAATNTGDRSAATNTGNQSAATNTGNQSAATNTGDRSAATNTGNWSAATNTGNWSAATNTGNWSAATVEGKESVAMSVGIEGKAKASIGSWIVLSEWKKDSNYDWHRIDTKVFSIDGEKMKPDIFYMLKNGKAVECIETDRD